MIYKGGGGLGLVVGVVVEMMEMIFYFFGALRELQWGRERERASFSFVQHPSPLFIEIFRVGEDPARTRCVSDCYNPQSWPFGLPVLLLLRSFRPDTRFE